jgi:hypothetical protein
MDLIKIENLGIEVSRKSAEHIRSEIVKRVEDGELDAVQVHTMFKFFDKLFNGDDKKNNGINQLLKDQVITEVERDKLRTEFNGFKIEVKETGVRYDYSNCNYPKLKELQEKKKELETEIKDAEEFLKSIKDKMTILDEETGEMTTIYPPVRMSSTSPVFTLK